MKKHKKKRLCEGSKYLKRIMNAIINAIEVTKILQKELIGAFIQGYGVMGQQLFLQITSEGQDEFNIIIESSVRLISKTFKERYGLIPYYSDDVEAFIIFDFLNPAQVKNIFCDDKAVLTIEFKSGDSLLIGEERLPNEPWTIFLIGSTNTKIIAEEGPTEYIVTGDWDY